MISHILIVNNLFLLMKDTLLDTEEAQMMTRVIVLIVGTIMNPNILISNSKNRTIR